MSKPAASSINGDLIETISGYVFTDHVESVTIKSYGTVNHKTGEQPYRLVITTTSGFQHELRDIYGTHEIAMREASGLAKLILSGQGQGDL